MRVFPSIVWKLLRTNANEFVQYFVLYLRTSLFSWLIFAKHGLFGIQLAAYSALSSFTDHGIYYITRYGIWLLTIFHIPYIHVTSPKLYLSFLFSIFSVYISSFCNVRFSTCVSQLDYAHLHAIQHEIPIANTISSLGFGIYFTVYLTFNFPIFKQCITVNNCRKICSVTKSEHTSFTSLFPIDFAVLDH